MLHRFSPIPTAPRPAYNVYLIIVSNLRDRPRLGRIDHFSAAAIFRRDRLPGHILNRICDTRPVPFIATSRVPIRLCKIIRTRTATADNLRRVLVDRHRGS